jgi:hypothetical protein
VIGGGGGRGRRNKCSCLFDFTHQNLFFGCTQSNISERNTGQENGCRSNGKVIEVIIIIMT